MLRILAKNSLVILLSLFLILHFTLFILFVNVPLPSILCASDADTGGMQYANWYFGKGNLSEISVVIKINNDPVTDDGIYFQAYDGYINGKMFYFGLQTRTGKPGFGLTGKGLIFSEFGTTDSTNIQIASGGWYEIGTYEGPFISTRLAYNWTMNKYILSIKFKESDSVGDWYEFWLEDLSNNTKIYAGALRFPFPSSELQRGITDNGGSWTELYYRKIIGVSLPIWSVSILEVSSISKGGEVLFPKHVNLKNAENFYHIDQIFHNEDNRLDFLIGGNATKSFDTKYWMLRTGTINIMAKLDGKYWAGVLYFSLKREESYNFPNVPVDCIGFWVGSYKISYVSGGPPNATLLSISPQEQAIADGKIIAFILNFTTSPTLDHFELDTIQNQTAGIPFNINIIAKDQYGETYKDFNSSVSLFVNRGSIMPTKTRNFNNGVLSNFLVTVPDVNAGVIITAKSLDKQGSSNSFNVTPQSCVITASAGFGGMILPLGPTTVTYGSIQAFIITPDSSHRISEVKVDGNSVGAVSTYTFENVTLDHTIEAIFETLIYTISAYSSYGGSIFPLGTVSVNSGDSKTFTISPNTGYQIKDVKVDGISVGKVSTYTFSNVTANHTIEVTFEKKITEIVIILEIQSKYFTVNGETRTLDSPPVIKNNRTLLPIRAVVEALGGTVGWDATEKKVTISLSSTTIELWIGKSIAKVNDVSVQIDPQNAEVVPVIVDGRTMLPVRFVAENLGATVNWNGTTQTIAITYQP